jgi:hypothetical protein
MGSRPTLQLGQKPEDQHWLPFARRPLGRSWRAIWIKTWIIPDTKSPFMWDLFPRQVVGRLPTARVIGGVVRETKLPPPPASLLRATIHLLRPLVRLLLRAGVTFPVLAEHLRQLFVEVAISELPEGRRTDSRLSLLTGVHRKEIRRLREVGVDELSEPEVVTLSSEIIARWLGDATYGGQGGPRLLPRSSDKGPSFETLVSSVTTDVRPRTVLDEWLSQGLVALDAQGRVRLEVRAFVPKPGEAAQLYYFGRNLHDHVAAAVANILARGVAPFPDQSVHYDGLNIPVAAALEKEARAAAGQLMLEINRRAVELTDEAEKNQSDRVGPTRRLNLGVYMFVEDEPPTDNPQS